MLLKRFEKFLEGWDFDIWVDEKICPVFSAEFRNNINLWTISIDIGDEDAQLQFALAGFGKSFFLAFNHLPIPKFITHCVNNEHGYDIPRRMTSGIEICFIKDLNLFDDWFIRFSLLESDTAYFDTPKFIGWKFDLPLPELLFGKLKIDRKNLYSLRSTLSLQTDTRWKENNFPVTCQVDKVVLSRPRLRKTQSFITTEVEVEEGSNGIPTGEYKLGVPRTSISQYTPHLEEYIEKEPVEYASLAIEEFKQKIEKTRKETR